MYYYIINKVKKKISYIMWVRRFRIQITISLHAIVLDHRGWTIPIPPLQGRTGA